MINSAVMISARLSVSSAPKPDTVKKSSIEPQKQCTEAYSSMSSQAMRSQVLGSINAAAATKAKSTENIEVNYTEGINCKVINETSGDETNQWWMDEMGYDNPPYLPKSKVQVIELQEDTKFCRVYDGENSGMYGGWVMKQSDLEGLTPEEIQDKFALPQKPIKICDVTIPAGTTMRTGLCNPLEGWGKGGGVQFDLMGQRVGKFDNERDLQTG